MSAELETELWHLKAVNGALQEAMARTLAGTKTVRNNAIEECARVADSYGVGYDARTIAAAIRALKSDATS